MFDKQPIVYVIQFFVIFYSHVDMHSCEIVYMMIMSITRCIFSIQSAARLCIEIEAVF